MSSILIRRNRDFYIKAKASFAFLLDLYPNAAAAYSLRLLRSAYTGACIRVRRSSDNAETDIGFDNNVLDTAALLAFVGSGNGFVSVWYDQSGAGLNVTQTSAGRQPRIVNGGVVELENGKFALNWYGTTQFFNGGNILGLGGQSLQIYAVARNNVPSNRVQLVAKSVFAVTPNRYSLSTGGASGTSANINTNTNQNYNPRTGIAHANQRLFNVQYFTFNEVRVFVDNTSVANIAATSGTVQNANIRFLIGATNNSTNNGETSYHRGTMQEVVMYIQPTADLPTLSDVNTNINNYYAIY